MNAKDFPQRILPNRTIGVHGTGLDPSQGYVTNIFYRTGDINETHLYFDKKLIASKDISYSSK